MVLPKCSLLRTRFGGKSPIKVNEAQKYLSNETSRYQQPPVQGNFSSSLCCCEHIGYMDILALIHVCFNCIIQCSDESANRQSLNIITGQPIFQLQPLPRSRIRSHSSLPSTSSTGSHLKNTRESRVKNYRSLSELENYELKGFMDLGFMFPKDKLSPHIMSMVPGLQKLTEEDGEQEGKRWVRRPYLSEAWPVDSPDSLLLNLDMLPKTPDGADMKKHLKFWAQRVAMLVHEEP